MPCYSPIEGYRVADGRVVFAERRGHGDFVGSVSVACGQCIGCRLRRASDWRLRCEHEASLHAKNCFVTLTYRPGNCPPGFSLCYADVQKFFKRVRWKVGQFRFFMCGEYGPETLRPHYHACLFGINFSDRVLAGKSASGKPFFSSAVLSALWPFGFATVQDFVSETAGYCAGYILTKRLGKDARKGLEYVSESGEILERAPEFARMSLRPGIGADWYRRHGAVVRRADFVASNGSKRRVPRYYDVLSRGFDEWERIELERFERSRLYLEDSTPDRLLVRARCAEAGAKFQLERKGV